MKERINIRNLQSGDTTIEMTHCGKNHRNRKGHWGKLLSERRCPRAALWEIFTRQIEEMNPAIQIKKTLTQGQ